MRSEHELPFKGELQRKALHLLALVIPAGVLLLGRTSALCLLVPVSVIVIGADILRARSIAFGSWIQSTFGFMMRPEERPPVGSPPVLNGATWVIVSATLLVVIFPTMVAAASFSSFMVADAAAAVVGRKWGTHPWGHSTRTLEGTSAFVIVGFPILAAFPGIPIWQALVSILLGAASEIPRRPLNDNIRVPFVMAAVLAMCRLLA